MKRLCWILLLGLLAGCVPTPPPPGGTIPIAIYLAKPALNGAEILAADLDSISLQAEPIIAPQDIQSYDLASHTLTVSQAAIQRVTALKVPLNGLGFVVTVDGERIYAGAFWTLISSLAFTGPSIMQPLEPDPRELKIERGYPGGPADSSADPRSDPRIVAAVEPSR